MSVKTYKYNDKTQLTDHFRVQEFKCKCGKNHNIKIDSDLCPLLEKLMLVVGANKGNISSGYRCKSHDLKVGGRGTGSHTEGYACDIIFYDKNNKVIPSKTIVLALEDIGHKKGIGYRCGGNENYTHIDVKPRKWYGDEYYSNTANCCNSFYEYFKIPKDKPVSNTWTTSTYKLLYDKCIRKTHKITPTNLLKAQNCTPLTKKSLVSQTGIAKLKKGTIITCNKIYNENGRIWGSYGNCWVVLCNIDGTEQAVKC